MSSPYDPTPSAAVGNTNKWTTNNQAPAPSYKFLNYLDWIIQNYGNGYALSTDLTTAVATINASIAANVATLNASITLVSSDLANTSNNAKGDALVGQRRHRTTAVGNTVDAWIEGNNVSIVGTGFDYPADSTGVVASDAIINAALSELPTGAGVLKIKAGTYMITRSLKLVVEGTQLVFEDVVNTRLVLSLVGANRGGWATTTAYSVGDIAGAPAGNPYNGYPIYYVCLTAHTSGTFATDLAAGKWELWCLISVRADSCRIQKGVLYVTGGSIGVASEGVYDCRVQEDMYFSATGANAGIGMLLSSYSYSGVLTAGAYPHRIENCKMSENYGTILHPGAYLTNCIVAVGSQNGCTLTGLTLRSDNPIIWGGGGGNSIGKSLLQSATGLATAATGSGNQQPWSGGAGIGIYHAGDFFIGDQVYFERFQYNTRCTGAPGTRIIANAYNSDASNNLFSTAAGSIHSPFHVTNTGVSAFVIDGLVDTYPINMNSAVIPTDMLGRRVSGNGATRSGCTLDIQASAVIEGRRFVIANDSWPIELIEGSTAYFGKHGSRIIIGQSGVGYGGIKTFCHAIGFIFINGVWNIEWVAQWALGAKTYAAQTFTANGQTLSLLGEVMDIDGGGGNRTGCLLPAPRGCGDELQITSQSANTVAFVSGAQVVIWSSAGAPAIGNSAGSVLSMTLGSNSSGAWYEKCRVVK